VNNEREPAAGRAGKREGREEWKTRKAEMRCTARLPGNGTHKSQQPAADSDARKRCARLFNDRGRHGGDKARGRQAQCYAYPKA